MRILPRTGTAPSHLAGNMLGRSALTPYWFLLPYLIIFVLFRLGPSIAGLGVSFTAWGIVGDPKWAGAGNYAALARDPLLRAALWNTLLFLAMAGPLLVIVALALALFLNQPYRGRTLGRIVVFAPYVFMSTVVAVIWNWIYDTNFGILNTLIGVRIPWLTSEQLALGSIVIATVWWTVGYNTILFLAGLQDIPQDLYEAGRIDGAGSWGLFRRITLPLLAPTMFTIIMLTIINSFQVFDLVYVMTAGGPGTATLTLVQYLYVTSFQFYRLGYGAAIGYLLFAILVIFAVLQFRSFRQGYQQR